LRFRKIRIFLQKGLDNPNHLDPAQEIRRLTQPTTGLAIGEVLREEFLLPLGLSPGALAKACGVPRTRIERLSNEATGVTADTALRLSKAFGTSPELWLNLQTDYDIQTAKRQIGRELARIEPISTKAA
jgi:addiction module HigA family antidote